MRTLLSLILGVVILVSLFRALVAPPEKFPAPFTLTITAGETLHDISTELYTYHAIRSEKAFEVFMLAFGNDKTISEGEYYFDKPLSSLAIAMRISGKEFGILKKKVTFPEGYTNVQMGDALAKVFPHFNEDQFLLLASGSQGSLFPDTYSFFPSVTPDLVIAAMKEDYQEKMIPIRADVSKSGHSESDIIIMASIIQKEAKGNSDAPTIAGILWNRLSMNMPLQVDAVPSTYTVKGLPSAPIDNPGLGAIEAAIHPVASMYLYYLHDSKGTVHYASTYQQHTQNIRKYLK
ncbi:MAG TPA: endolytic transglycosylase MltG [Candidatus Paceibacterota bacterium]|jgi:UPF0755 protein|nr:endolytic transglycosylase MltG [Candidatus Paceibacterota bacterium]